MRVYIVPEKAKPYTLYLLGDVHDGIKWAIGGEYVIRDIPELSEHGLRIAEHADGLKNPYLCENENLTPFFFVGNIVIINAQDDIESLTLDQIVFIKEWLNNLHRNAD